jgi:hypothetical protein
LSADYVTFDRGLAWISIDHSSILKEYLNEDLKISNYEGYRGETLFMMCRRPIPFQKILPLSVWDRRRIDKSKFYQHTF